MVIDKAFTFDKAATELHCLFLHLLGDEDILFHFPESFIISFPHNGSHTPLHTLPDYVCTLNPFFWPGRSRERLLLLLLLF